MTDQPSSVVDDLADRFWEALLELQPTTATMYGDERYADRLEDPSDVGRAKELALWRSTRRETESIPIDGLSVEDRITVDMIKVICDLGIEAQDQRTDVLRVVDQMGGPQTLLPVVTQFQKADTPERFEKYESRLRAYPAFMAANSDLLREGRASGLTAPRIVVERTIAQLERILEAPVDESPIPATAQVASEADRERVREIVRDVVRPADRVFLDSLRGDYLAASREDPGLWSAPNGDALYRTQIRAWTTVDMDPALIHQIGLDELETIDEERRAISAAAGYGDDTVALRKAQDDDPANCPRTKDELLERAREDIARALTIAPRYFGTMPRAGLEVRPVEEYKEARVLLPAGCRRGTPGHLLRERVRPAEPKVHEARDDDLPRGRARPPLPDLARDGEPEAQRVPPPRRGAYVEGWGLYSERLADEMGLFRTEGERFGMLDAQAWRAARLVVDTGLHALRWSRQQSIDFLLSAGLSATDATIETDRYIAWPGQALTYKLGQRAIESLRRELTERDGSRFDLREFHDQVLGHGSLPLATLARELPTWVTTPA
ncbi:MAG: DUF885 domain-containing protein [Chloroflexi bacterium]|nr:MAG: DUF885 domain-containing protein [Chloroflexota bacterium]